MTAFSIFVVLITFLITLGYFVESITKKEKIVEWGAFVGMIGSLIVLCVETAIHVVGG